MKCNLLHRSIRMMTGMAIALLLLSQALHMPGAAASSQPGQTIHTGVTLPAVAALSAENDLIVVIPGLKALSDQITQSLEGMDRANLLIGSRPLDQLKAALGFNVGVNDLGSLAIGITRGEQGEMVTTVVVPVSDAEAFLNGNFTARTGDALTMPTGRIVHGKAIEGNVILSTSPAVIQNHPPVRSAVERLLNVSDEATVAMVNRGDLFMIVNEAGLSDTMVRVLTMPPMNQLGLRADEVKQCVAQSCVEGAIISMDFDALGLIVRSMVRFKQDTPGSAMAPQPDFAGGDLLTRLGNKPYYTAGGMDAAGFGGASLHRIISAVLGLKEVPHWLAEVKDVQFAAYPSPTGVAGGLLNDAAIIARTPEPPELVASLRQHVNDCAQDAQNSGCTLQWETALKEDGPIGTTDAYEVRFAPVKADDASGSTITLARQLLFGRVGWRGFVKSTNDAVIITFSRRPAVLEAALDSATSKEAAAGGASAASAASGKGSLGSHGTIRTMRRMFPSNTAAEMYVSASPLAAFVAEFAAGFGQAATVPDVENNLPPIGFGAAARNGGIESALIIPAAVLANLLDETVRMSGKVHTAPVE